MSTSFAWPAVRRFAVLGLFCLLTTPVFADSITIGSITFLSQGTWGDPRRSIVTIQLDTTGITYDAYALGLPYSLVFNMNVFGWDTGPLTTIPPTGMLVDPPHFCPCESAVFVMTCWALDRLVWPRPPGEKCVPAIFVTDEGAPGSRPPFGR